MGKFRRNGDVQSFLAREVTLGGWPIPLLLATHETVAKFSRAVA
jgi:hypothetical protein